LLRHTLRAISRGDSLDTSVYVAVFFNKRLRKCDRRKVRPVAKYLFQVAPSISVLLCRTLRPVTKCDIKYVYVGCTVHQLVLTEIVLFHRSCLSHPTLFSYARPGAFSSGTGQSTRGKTAACSANMCNVAGQARMTRTGRVQPPIRRGGV